MSVPDIFKKYVENNDLGVIRVTLKELLRNDLTSEMYTEYLAYTEEQNVSIFEEHDNEEFLSEKEFTEDYLTEQLNQLLRNFSKKRVELIKAIICRIHGEEIQQQRKEEISYQNSHSKKIVGSIFIAVGGLIMVSSLFFANLGLTVVGTIAVVSGVILLLSIKES
ncbi:MAG: hypothetical protein KC455_02365 [Carnobacterium sp.]|nr:hypothetical protein [Carnobacterium sp.]